MTVRLRYRRDGASYVLYSVGPDGVDDGGYPVTGYVLPECRGDVLAGANVWFADFASK